MRIADKYLNQLLELGLYVSAPNSTLADGVSVMKPLATAGNCIAGYKTGFVDFTDESKSVYSDAPVLKLIYFDGVWHVHGVDSCGAMSPADFTDEWSTAEEAVEDIRNFFFGDPTRMKAKEVYRNDRQGEIAKAQR